MSNNLFSRPVLYPKTEKDNFRKDVIGKNQDDGSHLEKATFILLFQIFIGRYLG
jgi:hypothetical protein